MRIKLSQNSTIWRSQIVASTMLLLSLSACGGGTITNIPQVENQHSVNSSWDRLINSTGCEAMVPAYCSGAYGFTIKSTGAYAVGPDPSGKIITGNITETELAQLNTDATVIAKNIDLMHAPCGEIGTSIVAGSWNRLIVNLANNNAGSTNITTCVKEGNTADGLRLLSDVDQLRKKYYVVPF